MPILVLLWNSPIIKQLPCVYRLQTRLFLCKSHCVSLSTNNASKNTNYRNYCRLCVSLGVSRAAHWAVLLTHQGWSPISDISLEVLWLRLVVIVIIVYVYWDFAMVLMMMKKEDVTEVPAQPVSTTKLWFLLNLASIFQNTIEMGPFSISLLFTFLRVLLFQVFGSF